MFSKIISDDVSWCFIRASFLTRIINILKKQLQWGSLGWTEAGGGHWTIEHPYHCPPESPPPLVWPVRDLGWLLCQKIHAKKKCLSTAGVILYFQTTWDIPMCFVIIFWHEVLRQECHWALHSLYLVFLCYFGWARSSSLPAAGCRVVRVAIAQYTSDVHQQGWSLSVWSWEKA